jgi:hypothetical protein
MTNTPTMMATVYDTQVYTKNKMGTVVKITPKYIWIDRGWTGNQILEKYKQAGTYMDATYWVSTEYRRSDRYWFKFEQNPLEEFLSKGL